MRKSILFMAIMLVISFGGIGQAFAEKTVDQDNFGITFDIGIGGSTPIMANADARSNSFVLSLNPTFQYMVIDNLSVFGRFGWERHWVHDFTDRARDGIELDAYPFLFGARYYIELTDMLYFYAGGGLGFSILYYDGMYNTNAPFTHLDTKFSMTFHGGLQYDINESLALDAMFDIYLPNLGKVRDNEEIPARFSMFVGFSYYFPLEQRPAGGVKATSSKSKRRGKVKDSDAIRKRGNKAFDEL